MELCETWNLLITQVFPLFSLVFFLLSNAFLPLSVTPTFCITNDGKGCLWICICFFMSKTARDIDFKVSSPQFYVSVSMGAHFCAFGVELQLCVKVTLGPQYDAFLKAACAEEFTEQGNCLSLSHIQL